MHPDSARLAFRDMSPDDLDAMAVLLGDPEVMTYYPRPKTRAEAEQWIDWNRGLYRTHGYGLWLLTTREGEFVGDCGLTPQIVDGVTELEVGYHVRPAMQNRGYATEAAAASREFARTALGATRLIAIIHPGNQPSQRVAEKIGLHPEKRTRVHGGRDAVIYAAALEQPLCARRPRSTGSGWPTTVPGPPGSRRPCCCTAGRGTGPITGRSRPWWRP
jgi:RimJ/RimL family protein N-acetyltransferase